MPKKVRKTKEEMPELNTLEDAHEQHLIDRTYMLEEKIDNLRNKAKENLNEATGWSITGGVLLLAFDWTLLGGIGTGFAALSGATWAHNRLDIRRLNKELKNLKNEISDYNGLKLAQQALMPKPLPNPINDDFKKAALSEAESLKKRLAELEKQMEDIQNPKPVILDKKSAKTMPKSGD